MTRLDVLSGRFHDCGLRNNAFCLTQLRMQ